ncbi:MAG TPA: pyridoxal phosphate-dependent aminotransferase [Verrucomicrobiae bacterium]|nr:pyridoxal phosphate-dependent aminotransferase [Verrucomicrobiae bacterium]
MRFSRRTGWATSPNRIASKLQELRERGEPFLDLTESNPTRCGFSYLDPELLEAFRDPANLTYAPDPRGLLKAREAVCAYYARKGIAVEPEQVFLTANTSEAYGFIFRLLADPGDGLLAPKPSYPLFDYLAGLHDAELIPYPLSYDGRWTVDWAPLEADIPATCKGLILVNPNNPTGNYMEGAARTRLRDFCLTRNLALVCDEVFLDYPLQSGRAPASFAGETETLTFTMSGISKILGLPQMKISWIVVSGPGPERVEALRRLEVIADTYLSAGTPPQNALPAWFRSQPAITGEILDRVRGNYAAARDEKGPLRFLAAEGGWYTVAPLPQGRHDEEWVLELLERDRVFVHPGYFFDFEGGDYAVVSLLPEPSVFREGLDRLASRLRG